MAYKLGQNLTYNAPDQRDVPADWDFSDIANPRPVFPTTSGQNYGITNQTPQGSSLSYLPTITGGSGNSYGSDASSTMPEFPISGSMKLPEYTPRYQPLPTFSAPRWDEAAIDTLTQKRAAPGLRALRSQVQRIAGRSYGSPQVTRMTLRDALQGYGQGVEQTLSGANEAAVNEYGSEYSKKFGTAQAEYQSQANAANVFNEQQQDLAKTRYSGEYDLAKTKYAKEYDIAKSKYATAAQAYLNEISNRGTTENITYDADNQLKTRTVQNRY